MITWFRRLFGRPAATLAERDAVISSLRDAGVSSSSTCDVDAVALAARRALANPNALGTLQAELGDAGVKLSATPPTAHALLRRLSAFGA